MQLNSKPIRKSYSKLVDLKLPVPNTQDKKEKARQSAINTRIRRKAYVTTLEEKIEQLQAQINQKGEQKSNLFGLMENFLQDRKYQFELLEQAYKANDEKKINVITNSLRFKYGISGQGRMAAINKVCELLIDLLLPMHMRYLFWVASENFDLFERDKNSMPDYYSFDFSDSQINCLQQFGLGEQQIQKIQSMQDQILNQRSQYDSVITQIFQLKDQIQKESVRCQEIVDSIWQQLKPKQSAELLIQLDKTRYEQFKAKKVYPECILKTLEMRVKTQELHGQQSNLQQIPYNQMKMENKQWEDMQNNNFSNYFN